MILRPAAVVSMALLVVASTALVALSPHFVPPMDDTWIHLVYGRSLLTSSPLNFNPGQPSSGFTSPAWLLPSALASMASSHAELSLMGLSLLAAAAALLLPGLPRAAPLLVFTGPFLFHSSSGMETGLAFLLTALSWARLSGRSRPGRDGIVLAISGLCRPEFFLLMVPYVIRIILQRKAGIIAFVCLLGPSAVLGAAWISWNLHATGQPLPASFYAKAGAPPAPFQLARSLILASPLTLALGLGAAAALLRKGRIEGSIPLILLAASAATQPNPWFMLRYYAPCLFSCGLASASLLALMGPGARRILLAASLALAIPGLIAYGRFRVLASRDVLSIDVGPALFLQERSGSDAVVACADAGAMKWLGGLEVQDVDRLVTSGPLAPLDSMDYAALFPRQYSDLIEQAGNRFRLLRGFRSETPIICGEDEVRVFEVVRDSGAEGS
jgi:hypothetical protein